MSENKDSEQPQSGSSSPNESNETPETEAGKETEASATASKLIKPEVAEKVKEKMSKAKEALVSTTQQVVAAVRQEASGPFVEEAKRKAAEAKTATKEVLMRSPELKEFTQDILYGGATDAVASPEVAQEADQAVPQTSSKKRACQPR